MRDRAVITSQQIFLSSVLTTVKQIQACEGLAMTDQAIAELS